jgi:DNA helicase-2/ATP-dependent DNA helicase PcrA
MEMSNEETYKRFVTTEKSLIIAPAGYGKTHTLAESLKHVREKQLVLTHTHAGVSALKEKLKLLNVPLSNYQVETISSFAQKYSKAFNYGGEFPEQKNSIEYYPHIIKKATKLFKKKSVQDVLRITYSGLFVDEYQDCTLQQHEMILALSNTLPTHILGDPLQGIFGFRGQTLVDFNIDLDQFTITEELNVPWRWNKTNEELGKSMHKARTELEKGSIDFSCFKNSAEILIVDDSNDLINPKKEYNKLIWRLINSEKDLLLIHPNSANINGRISLSKRFKRRFSIIESIDDKAFYEYAEKLDALKLSESLYLDIALFVKGSPVRGKSTRKNTLLTGLSTFIKDKKPQRSNDPQKSKVILLLNETLNEFSFLKLSKLFRTFRELGGVNYYRKELFWDLIKSLEIAHHENISVLEAMENLRNLKRRNGKKVSGKLIGTTLLTKGLEFSTVVVLNAHEFKDKNNLYVALSRASNKLIIISEEIKLDFN